MCQVCYCLYVSLQLWNRLFVQQCDWVLFSYLMHREREMRKGDKRVAPLYCVIWYVVAWGLSLSSFPPLMFVCDEPCWSCHSWPGRYLIQFSLHKAILNRQYLCHITVVACGSKGPIRIPGASTALWFGKYSCFNFLRVNCKFDHSRTCRVRF